MIMVENPESLYLTDLVDELCKRHGGKTCPKCHCKSIVLMDKPPRGCAQKLRHFLCIHCGESFWELIPALRVRESMDGRAVSETELKACLAKAKSGAPPDAEEGGKGGEHEEARASAGL